MHAETSSPWSVMAALHTRELLLPTPRGFVFAHTLSFLASFPATRGEQHVGAGVLTKCLSLEGRALLVSLREAPGEVALWLEVRSSSQLDEDSIARLVARVRFWLGLDEDLAPFRLLAANDAPFAPIAERWLGHHHVKFPSPIEIAVWAVLGQRSQRAGRPVKRALIEALGPTVVIEGITHRAFPEPAALADARVVAPLVADAARADAIVTIARAFSDPSFQPYLREARLEDADARLRSLPFIGPWSSAFILFRGLGRMERLASASEPILLAARRVYGDVSERELRATAERYAAWCGYWALYLRRG